MEKLLSELVELGKAEKFNGELDYGAKIDSDAIFEAMREVGTDEKSQEIIESRFLETASLIQNTLLAISFSNFLKSSDDSEAAKKSRRCARLLLNLVQRSPQFAARTSSDSVELLESLLATSTITAEILLFLVKTANSTWLEFQKSSRYAPLLERVLTCAKDAGDDDESSSSLAYFSILLEKDYGFLANCYAEMTPSAFCALLDVVKCLQEGDVTIHSNNLLFVLNLIELMVVDFGAFLTAKANKDPKSVDQRREATPQMLYLLVEIVGVMCSNTEMTSKLNEKAAIAGAVMDILDTILHGEASFIDFRSQQGDDWPELPPDEPKFARIREKIEEHRRIQKLRKDRPKEENQMRLARVEGSESLNELSMVFYHKYQTISEDYDVMGRLKLACVKAIINLCPLSPGNQLAASHQLRIGVLSVLQCTARRPAYYLESPLMRNWCIFCVRQLTDGCPMNQKQILMIEQPDDPIVDRARLLAMFDTSVEEIRNAKLAEH